MCETHPLLNKLVVSCFLRNVRKLVLVDEIGETGMSFNAKHRICDLVCSTQCPHLKCVLERGALIAT